MPRKKKQDLQEKVDDKMQELLDKHQEALEEQPKKPKIDPLKKEANKLQNTLRKNRFYNKYESFDVSKELLNYFDTNKLDKYGQELIARD
jgi:hypothetical protein